MREELHHLGRLQLVDADGPRRRTRRLLWLQQRLLWRSDIIGVPDEMRLSQLRENSLRVEQTVDVDDQLQLKHEIIHALVTI